MRDSWKTWVLVAILLIFAGVASAIVPFILDQFDDGGQSEAAVPSHPTVTTIDVSQLPFIGEVIVEIPFIADNIQGQPITLAQAFGILAGVVLVSTGALGLLLTIPVIIYSRLVTRVYADDDYQAAESELENRQKSILKERQQVQPPSEATDPRRLARYKVNSLVFLIVLLALITSLTVTTIYFSETTWSIGSLEISAALVINLAVVLLSLLILYLALRRRDPLELDSEEMDNRLVNWGTIWVILTGLIIVGIGTGLAIALAPGG
jgi:ABC-type multidrug transport system fused ATPase/permease subunit